MTATVLAPYLTQEFFANNGQFLAGGLLYSYQAGTVVPIATFTDYTGLTANPNPIQLNSRGEVPALWILPNVAYKFVLQDSTGNTIWSRDQVTNAQLLTLFGGVDTGGVNAYILNFVANFSSLVNGIVIYWIPANSNTGPSTINVNGLGVVPILNQGGSPLTSNQLFANQIATMMYYNGNWLLISSGYSSAAAQSIFIAARSIGAGNQTLTSNATNTIIFDQTFTNQNNNYSGTTGLYTAPTSGIYQFTTVVAMVYTGAGGLVNGAYLSKNLGTSVGQLWNLSGLYVAQTITNTIVTGSGAVLNATANFVLNAGDTVCVRAQQPNPGGGFVVLGGGTASQFSGYRIG